MALISTGINGDLQTAVTTQIVNRASTTGKSLNRFSTLDIQAGTFTKDTNFWLSTLDLSCLAVWNSSSNGPQKGGTLITPKHIVVANHYPLGVGDQVAFIGNDDIIYKRNVVSVAPRTPSPSNYYSFDYNICTLDSVLPNTVVPAVLPSQDILPLLQGTGNKTSFSLSSALPVITTNQFNQAGVGMMSQVSSYQDFSSIANINQGFTAPYSNYAFNIIVGDSGHPVFAPLANGRLMLISSWTYPSSGPFYPIIQIESRDTFNNVVEEGFLPKIGSETLTFVSGYNTYDTNPPVVVSPEKFPQYLQRSLNSKINLIANGQIGNTVVIADANGNLRDSGNVPGGITIPSNALAAFNNKLNVDDYCNALLIQKTDYNSVVFNISANTFHGRSNFAVSATMSLDANINDREGADPNAICQLLSFGAASWPAVEFYIDANLNLLLSLSASPVYINRLNLGSFADKIGLNKTFNISFIYQADTGMYYFYLNGNKIYEIYNSGFQDAYIPTTLRFIANPPGIYCPIVSGVGINLKEVYASVDNYKYEDPFNEILQWVFASDSLIQNTKVRVNNTCETIGTKVWLNKGSYVDTSYNNMGHILQPGPFNPGANVSFSFGNNVAGIGLRQLKNVDIERSFVASVSNTMIPGLDSGVNELQLDLNSINYNGGSDKFVSPMVPADSIIVMTDRFSARIPSGMFIKDVYPPNKLVFKNDNGSDELSGNLIFNVRQVYKAYNIYNAPYPPPPSDITATTTTVDGSATPGPTTAPPVEETTII